MSYEVVIEDFDFLTHQLRVQVGEKIIFKLSNQVPFHAEHIIYGRSDNKLLCFESEVLQIQENTSFEYIPQVTGDIFVTCKIYLDMCCEINVRDGDSDDSDDCDNESESSSDKQSEEDESEAEYSLETKQNAEFLHLPPPSRKGKEIPSPIIEGVAHRVIPIIEDRRIHRFMDEDDDESSQHHGELSAHERDSDSFYDSDDVISLDDYDNNSHLFRPSMSDEMKSPIVSLNQADIANIFEHMPLDFINYKDGDEIHPYAINLDKRFQQEDDQDETEEYPLYLSHYDPLTPLSNMYCYPTSVQRILPPLPPLHGTSSSSSSSSSSRVIPVLVNEFSFNPKQVVCSFRDRIKFLLNDQEISHCTLYCEGEFDSILLDKNYQPYFIYQPSQCGSFIIKNEIYNFVCKVIVHDSNDLSRMNHQIESPPKLFGSFHPNMNNLPKPIFNMASLEQKEIDYSEKNAEYIDPSSAMMPNDYIHPSFTVTYPYEEEEFADVLQDLTYLNVDPDLTLVEDVKPIVFSSSADSTTAVSLATSEDSRDDDVDTDPEASFSGATNSLVLDSSANNTELEKLSRKAKKKKRRKEKQKLQKKMTREASNREDNMMNLDENLTAPENRKLEQDQESLEERIELSPEKDRSDGYMLATADFSEDFEVLSEDSQVDGEQGVKEGGSTSPDKLELNVTSSIMSPIIQRKTNIIISPVDKKAPIDDSIYDENVSFDSDEDNLAAEESKSEPQFTIPDSLVQLSEEESVKSLPALIPKPSTPPCSSKNSEDVSTPAATNTSHHVYTTPTSGKKTIALLSALGLKSKSIEERNPISSFDLLVETSESKGSPQKYHDPNHFQSPLSSVPDDISNISPSLINDEQQREQELQEFLLKRFEVMREKYDHNLPDVLPRGKEVPVYCWSSLPSKEDNQTHDESDSNTKSIENNASKPVIFPSPRQSRQKPKKSSFRGISGVYVPPPARSSSNDDGEKKLRGVSVATNSSSTASPRTSSSHKSKHKT